MEANRYVCKRDGKPMYLVEETEKLSTGEYRIVFMYKCLACGYTINSEHLIVKRDADSGVVLIRRTKRAPPQA